MTLIALAFNIVYIRVDVAENKRRSYLIMPVGNIGKQLYWVIVAHSFYPRAFTHYHICQMIV